MWQSILTFILTLLTRLIKPKQDKAENDIIKANKVETDIERKPSGDAERVLKSRWKRG